ncbi:DNA-binding response regulator, OmpR family, contains REC and winged-helix (wHTH) domain [Paenibacillus sophorae]|uniref:Heme response regulator HssR n=1 Tax=Paenibacillus sophorae TaxID=1333845 RepID=A0A1H8FD65_9BACL|nr:response regulator transcription factor [Paenibacillus sophorae]QWU13844.1 response regulator transcription factor [Paenibacillus sophorae]SEN29851.1 DNA-binding response regulator, OmpR family, contains REC and winged-helix (wHTH) domain [Paenibacillus sophorae]
MVNILVVDDNESIRKLMTTYLIRDGYHVFAASDGLKALEVLDTEHIDLMIADIMMPNMDGYTLTEELRSSRHELPILMITAKETFEDKKKGFLVGTDDYMVKPIDFDEMLLRVHALLRRAKISNEHRIVIGEIILDYETLTVTTPAETFILPKKEFYLLFKLLSYPQKIFTRQDLMDEIWGLDNDTDERTIDVHIKRLREKFDGFEEFKIITVRGLGYKVEKLI